MEVRYKDGDIKTGGCVVIKSKAQSKKNVRMRWRGMEGRGPTTTAENQATNPLERYIKERNEKRSAGRPGQNKGASRERERRGSLNHPHSHGGPAPYLPHR
jgi:hypothetical protein